VAFSTVITVIAHITVWACGLLVMYVWLGYPAILWTFTRLFRRRERALPLAGESIPSVTVIVAVHNEEAALAGKLENCLRLLYARDRLRIVVASDGSTDGTLHIANEFASRHPGLHVWAQRNRAGKTATQNVAVRLSDGEILLFSDVDTELDAHFLEQIVLPFADRKVGCVAGLLTWTNPHASAVASGGDFYWRYEHLIWRMESRLGLLAWASGACLAVRRELFTPMEAQYGEDTVLPLDVVSLGYRVVFQPDAIASDKRIVGAGAELRARARMTLRSLTGTLSRKHLLNPLRFPQIAWAILSHKLLRWLVPYFLMLGFVSNVLLLGRAGVYPYTLAVQVIFYVSGTIGYFLDKHGIRVRFLSIIYAFCLMNLGVAVGVAQAILGRRILAYRSED
jgi:cellulose synthase/poly-beta-1,6-N-acetylglucosamine synthase-like glycosyltransferase